MSSQEVQPSCVIMWKMKGELFRYGQKPVQVAFQSAQHPRQLVLIPGLTDGLLSLTYTSSLATELDSRNCSFVQPLLSSSFQVGVSINV